MKTYIFFTRRFINIGGSEQYLYNKKNFLERQGWRVLIFSGQHGSILINDFKNFERYIYTELYCAPSCFSRRTVEKVINRIVCDIGECDAEDCVVESVYLPSSLWAEMVASRIKARHLAFPLQERHVYDEEAKKYLWFKYNRHELAGIVRDSVRQMLGDDSVELRDDVRISASCNNVFDDCDDPYSKLLDPKADYTFGSIGRLVKPCVPAIVEGFCSYARNHPDKRFNVVMIGGSIEKGRKEEIRKKLSSVSNIHAVMTGDVYPIPRSFASKIDVFVSTAGAATATYIEKCPTVKVNPLNGEPLGVTGLDYMPGEKNMYASSPDLSIEKCIDNAIFNRDKIRFVRGNGNEYISRMNTEFQRQLTFLNFTDKKEYYDAELLMQIRQPHTRFPWLNSFLGHILGGDGYEKFRKYIGK